MLVGRSEVVVWQVTKKLWPKGRGDAGSKAAISGVRDPLRAADALNAPQRQGSGTLCGSVRGQWLRDFWSPATMGQN